jgi:thiamine-monophosphate kinase
MPSEFDLIKRFFTRPSRSAVLGVGDDAALLQPTPGRQLAVSADMLVAGRHFFAEADPEALGHKALAVNLSDMAAMGALPRWALLSVALPEADETWLAAFARGFLGLAEAHGVELVGGDTTRGPLNLSVTILGEVTPGRALRRDAAQIGDDIWVSGQLGGAALGLQHLRGEISLADAAARDCLERLHRPQPRVALGTALAGLAHAGIDISDGLLADLGHILERSGVGARLHLDALPIAPPLAGRADRIVACALNGGDDYELCITAPQAQRAALIAAADKAGVAVCRIGEILAGPGLTICDAAGDALNIAAAGYDHFGQDGQGDAA